MKVLIPISILAAAGLLASPVAAQSARYGDSVWRQFDRPGDFRCDAYWDRGRTDCDAGWRDQRPFRSEHHGWGRGPGYGHGASPGYDPRQRAAYGPYGAGATAYFGSYGRPDLVSPGRGSVYGQGYGYAHGYGHAQVHGAGRDPARVDWCRWNYRSYDPVSGYYRAYSGRLVFCG